MFPPLNRRDFLSRSLKGSSLFALGATVPHFIASTAQAAENGKDNILVVLEMGGGNDGLNTVIPYADDLYHKARPTLRYNKNEVLKIDDHVGLHPSLNGLKKLFDNDRLAIVQGVGYPNPNRSHFESMDVWQTADLRGKSVDGWLGRALGDMQVQGARIPAFHLGAGELPLAMQGSTGGVPSMNTEKPFGLNLGKGNFYGHNPRNPGEGVAVREEPTATSEAAEEPAEKREQPARAKLIRGVAESAASGDNDLLGFVRRTSLETYTAIDRLTDIMNEKVQVPDAEGDFSNGRYRELRSGLSYELKLVARMIKAGFGTRIFYVSIDGFDTHSGQKDDHAGLMTQIGNAVQQFYNELDGSGDADRVVLMTYSEFGRRVKENGSKGTDHGSGSCMFVAGPAVNTGPIGEHPSLEDNLLDRGDLKFHTDFRQVYATLLDRWLGCSSRRVLGGEYKHVPLFGERKS